MKTRPAILLLCALCCPNPRLQAQVNLVPNWSFEQFDTCPNMEDQIHFATGWSKYSSSSNPTNTTPDYYNACSSDTLFGIPKSLFCYQADHRNCNAYIGLVTLTTSGYSNYREHIGIQLTEHLIIGQKYYISFYTVMGESVFQGTQFGLPTNNIGIRLSTTPYTGNIPAPIDNFAHLRSISIINDSVNWHRISGSIIADSAYQYLIIGNFFSDNNTDTIEYNCGSCLNALGYYLIDDVCISIDSLFCNGGMDTLPCDVSVNVNKTDDQVMIYPNPSNEVITIESKINISIIEIFNVLGEKVLSHPIINSMVRIDISILSKGTYFLIIKDQKNNYLIEKQLIKY